MSGRQEPSTASLQQSHARAQPTTWSPRDEAGWAAVQLAFSLEAGWRPPDVPSPIPLYGDERYIQSAEFRLLAFAEQNRWRYMNAGTLHVTTRRFGLQGVSGWNDIVYSDVRASETFTDGLVVYVAGHPPLKLAVAWPEYLSVLFDFLAHGRIRRPVVDADLLAKALAVGKEVPHELQTQKNQPELGEQTQ